MLKTVKIGDILPRNRYFLAPLAGITDSAFRTICTSFGAGMTYTEMVSAKALTFGDRKSLSLLEISKNEMPCIAQIFGNDPDVLAQGALIALENSSAVGIDINMGCPVPKITSNGEGSALMADIKRAEAIIKAVRNVISVPLSVKFRRGYTVDTINAVEFAKMAESAGVDAICVHGRTRTQMYSGQSDMQTISDVKNAVSIPLIASGDIFSPESALRAMNEYGADAVVVARGAMGNPFVFRECIEYEQYGTYSKPTRLELTQTMKRHIELCCEKKGEQRAMSECRKHMLWYLKGIPGAKKIKVKMTQMSNFADFCDIIEEINQIVV